MPNQLCSTMVTNCAVNLLLFRNPRRLWLVYTLIVPWYCMGWLCSAGQRRPVPLRSGRSRTVRVLPVYERGADTARTAVEYVGAAPALPV